MFGLPSVPAALLRPQALLAGAALFFVLYVYLIAIPSAEQRGKAAALQAASERALSLIQEKNENADEIRDLSASDLCRELLSDGMPDDACD